MQELWFHGTNTNTTNTNTNTKKGFWRIRSQNVNIWKRTCIEKYRGIKLKSKKLKKETTWNGRGPQNIKIWITQIALIRSSLNSKLMISVPNWINKFKNEDDLKWKMTWKYLKSNINHWSDLPQILN